MNSGLYELELKVRQWLNQVTFFSLLFELGYLCLEKQHNMLLLHCWLLYSCVYSPFLLNNSY